MNGFMLKIAGVWFLFSLAQTPITMQTIVYAQKDDARTEAILTDAFYDPLLERSVIFDVSPIDIVPKKKRVIIVF